MNRNTGRPRQEEVTHSEIERLWKRHGVSETPRRPRKKPSRFPHRHEDDLVTNPVLLPDAISQHIQALIWARGGLRSEIVDSRTTMPRGWDFGNITDLTISGEPVTLLINVAKDESSGFASKGKGLGTQIGSARDKTPEGVISRLVGEIVSHFSGGVSEPRRRRRR